MSEERSIEKTIDFAVPVERLWRAITDETELAQWFGHEVRFEPVVGYEGAMIWRDHGSFALRVEAVEEPTRLVWSWVHENGVAFADAPATTIEWTLSELEGGGSRLFLREHGFRSDLHHRQNTDGWNEELGELVTYLA